MSNVFNYNDILFGGPPFLVEVVDPDVVVSLSFRVVARSWSTRFVYHYPVRDFGVYPVRHIGAAVDVVRRHVGLGHRVYVHCDGGCGRTATVISAYLILFHGINYREAVEMFREQRGCTVESNEQMAFLAMLDYARRRLDTSKLLDLLKRSEELSDFIDLLMNA